MTPTSCGAVSALLLGLVLSWVEPAGAVEPEAPPAPLTRAQELFEQARSLLDAGAAPQACPLLEQSLTLEPALVTRFHLALCYEALGKLASALKVFSEVADLALVHGHTELAADAQRHAASLARRAGRLRIVADRAIPGGAQIERDGVLLEATELGVEVPVDAGTHRVRAFGDGLVEWSEQIDVLTGPGIYTVVVPELASKRLVQRRSFDESGGSSSEPIDRSFLGPTHRKIAVVAGSVGVVCIGLGSVFALRAISKSDASDRAGCLGNVCPTPAGVELRREAQVAGNVATGSMIGGLTGLATAAALFLLVDGTGARAARSVVPRASAQGGELVWEGRF